mmetsp:Transcript_26497/g.59981  ORF Transcript_26497/g.59981 Transcript_26497/m.59981 type:complete len:546 (-) Transcript_26497:44-1681(-)
MSTSPVFEAVLRKKPLDNSFGRVMERRVTLSDGVLSWRSPTSPRDAAPKSKLRITKSTLVENPKMGKEMTIRTEGHILVLRSTEAGDLVRLDSALRSEIDKQELASEAEMRVATEEVERQAAEDAAQKTVAAAASREEAEAAREAARLLREAEEAKRAEAAIEMAKRIEEREAAQAAASLATAAKPTLNGTSVLTPETPPKAPTLAPAQEFIDAIRANEWQLAEQLAATAQDRMDLQQSRLRVEQMIAHKTARRYNDALRLCITQAEIDEIVILMKHSKVAMHPHPLARLYSERGGRLPQDFGCCREQMYPPARSLELVQAIRDYDWTVAMQLAKNGEQRLEVQDSILRVDQMRRLSVAGKFHKALAFAIHQSEVDELHGHLRKKANQQNGLIKCFANCLGKSPLPGRSTAFIAALRNYDWEAASTLASSIEEQRDLRDSVARVDRMQALKAEGKFGEALKLAVYTEEAEEIEATRKGKPPPRLRQTRVPRQPSASQPSAQAPHANWGWGAGAGKGAVFVGWAEPGAPRPSEQLFVGWAEPSWAR